MPYPWNNFTQNTDTQVWLLGTEGAAFGSPDPRSGCQEIPQVAPADVPRVREAFGSWSRVRAELAWAIMSWPWDTLGDSEMFWASGLCNSLQFMNPWTFCKDVSSQITCGSQILLCSAWFVPPVSFQMLSILRYFKIFVRSAAWCCSCSISGGMRQTETRRRTAKN